MIRWIRKSLGRKAVLFAFICIAISSVGLFQFLYYVSAEGYISASRNRNQMCSSFLIEDIDKEKLKSVSEKSREFYLSRKNIYDEFSRDSGSVDRDFVETVENEDYTALKKQLLLLADKYGVFGIRLVLVDFKNGTLFTYLASLLSGDEMNIWVYRKENIKPSDNEYPFSDEPVLQSNADMFGKVISLPFRFYSDDGNMIRMYVFLDTDEAMSVYQAGYETKNTVLGLVIVSIIMGIIILLLINIHVVEPLNSLSNATRDLITKLSSGTPNTHVFHDLDIRTGDEIEHLYQSILVMEDEIYSYMDRLKTATAEQERISTELYIAESIQTKMLPSAEPDFTDQPCYDLAASMHPAREIGGDFYDFFMLSEDKLAFLIADVSGKGIPAALVMAIGKTMLKNYTKETGNIAEAFRITNNLLLDSSEISMFITAFEGILDLRTGELRYVNAGHEDPFIMEADGEFVLRKERHAIVLGAVEDMCYKTQTMMLKPGDRLYIYTDGVPEAQAHDEKMFGLEGARDALNAVRDKSAAQVIEAVRESVGLFVKDEPQFDDMTMLCLDFRKYYE